MKDAELIECIQMNNSKDCEEAIRWIYREFYPMTESLVLKNSGNKEDAKDIFQEAMIIFYSKVKSDDFVLSSKISTFLFSISRNQWFKKIRDEKKKKNIDITAPIPDTSTNKSLLKDLEYSESQIVLADLLEKSGEKCVKLLKHFYFEKLSMLKIAHKFHYSSEQVAKNQKVRCLKKIRAILLQNKKYQENLTNIF